DCLHRLQRPKLDYYDDYTFYVTHIVREKENELVKEELDFFVAENFIVSFHQSPAKELQLVWDRLLSQEFSEKWDTYYIFYRILDKIVDNYFPVIYKIEDELAVMEDNTENKSMNNLMNELFETRNMLLNLRHTVNPMRD